MATRIVVNGQEYSSVDEMPPDVRRIYDQTLAGFADVNRNGVPDFIEQTGIPGAPGVNVTEIRHSSFTVNDQTFDDLSKLPPDVRRLYEAAMHNVDAGREPVASSRTSVTLNFGPKGLHGPRLH